MNRIFILIIVGSLIACNGTKTSEDQASADTLQVLTTDTLPFEQIADTLETVIDETEEVGDTIQSNKTNTANDGNIKKGNEQPANSLDGVRKKLAGSWKWEKTKCCGRNAQWYTDTLQENRVLKFKADGTVETYQNGILRSKERYKLEKGPIYEERPQITIGDKTHGPALLDFENNQMIINYGYMDLQIEYYTKVK